MSDLHTIINKRWKNEKEVTTSHLQQCRSRGAFTFKIPDIGNTLKPFDAFVTYGWTTYAIEYKYGRSKDVLSIIEPHQWYALTLHQRNWWTSLIIHYYNKSIYYYWIENGWANTYLIAEHECLN